MKLPLGLSIAVTFISALTVIGLPTEAYFYGFVTMWYAFTVVIPTAVASLYYIPLVYRLNVSTIYEVSWQDQNKLCFQQFNLNVVPMLLVKNSVERCGSTVLTAPYPSRNEKRIRKLINE